MNVFMLAFCMALIDDPDEQEKFSFIYDNFYEDMYRAAHSILKDHHLAEDALQNTLLSIASAISTIEMDKNPRGFAVAVAFNEAKSIAAKYYRENNMIDPYRSGEDVRERSVHEIVEGRENINDAARYVMEMGEDYYNVFVLRIFHGMKYKEMAKMLNEKNVTLRKRMQRIREHLLERAEDNDEE